MYVLMCCSASSHGGLVIHIVSKIDDHRCISCHISLHRSTYSQCLYIMVEILMYPYIYTYIWGYTLGSRVYICIYGT
jgi:hypothetical protein